MCACLSILWASCVSMFVHAVQGCRCLHIQGPGLTPVVQVYPFEVDPSLNLELDWQSAGPVSAPYSAWLHVLVTTSSSVPWVQVLLTHCTEPAPQPGTAFTLTGVFVYLFPLLLLNADFLSISSLNSSEGFLVWVMSLSLINLYNLDLSFPHEYFSERELFMAACFFSLWILLKIGNLQRDY